jgi:peptidoglycan/LPS O-acetylase OafA/YrhL
MFMVGATFMPPRLTQLDSIRGIAALAIVILHFSFLIPAIASPVTHEFYLAVDVFFVLSGFVMVYVYGPAFLLEVRPRDVGTFLWARLSRIYPLHLATLAALVFLYVAQAIHRGGPTLGEPEDMHALVYNLLLLHGPWIDHPNWNAPSWSISVEWHFYLVFPLATFLLGRVSVGGLAALLAAAAAALAAFGIFYGFNVASGPLLLWRAAPEFAIGMALARLYRAGLLPLWMLNGAMARILAWRPLVHLGDISYSIYLVHGVVWVYVGATLHLLTGRNTFLFGWPPSLAFLLTLMAATIAISELSYRWIERPAQNAMRSLVSRRM